MLAAIKRQDFESLDDISLIWTCIEPTIEKIRGKNFAIKSAVHSQLTEGLQALLMFQVLYGHTVHGIEEFYRHLSYLLSNKGMWSQLKKGMHYFGAHDMISLLDEMNAIYENFKAEESPPDAEQHDIRIGETEKGTPLFMSLSRLDARLKDILPSTILLIGSHIRSNPEQFIQIID